MSLKWKQTEPIYRQLADRLRALVLRQAYAEGEALPSVRQLAAELRINPITISKALQILVDEGVIEKRRGLGMYVMPGASADLLRAQRAEFVAHEWPRVLQKIELLGLTLDELPRDSSQAHSFLEEGV
mgnify:CR=1 FL=1